MHVQANETNFGREQKMLTVSRETCHRARGSRGKNRGGKGELERERQNEISSVNTLPSNTQH